MINSTDILFTLGNARRVFFKELINESGLSYMELELLLFLEENSDTSSISEVIGYHSYNNTYIKSIFVELINKGYIETKISNEVTTTTRIVIHKKSRNIIAKAKKCKENFNKVAFVNFSPIDMEIIENAYVRMITNLKIYRSV